MFAEAENVISSAVEARRLCVAEASMPKYTWGERVKLYMMRRWDKLCADRDGTLRDGDRVGGHSSIVEQAVHGKALVACTISGGVHGSKELGPGQPYRGSRVDMPLP